MSGPCNHAWTLGVRMDRKYSQGYIGEIPILWKGWLCFNCGLTSDTRPEGYEDPPPMKVYVDGVQIR